ncbi:Mrp/NBP35 family ATP-binding protein [Terribacillus saccharophilus]|uniref:Iron-sulfur cluster carrier protein n=1 Tax=Terribacillus saccharophilus TaxID=361277 RepID=A0AAX2EKE2_9BACI|nr:MULTISPECIES: Mrp/NBP35 family ATP-binding protein [Terribacillus]MCM3227487.1 Mrp/NBP35 family ATP-binding protein [Terribacillus saccharophilus]MEC0284597.1 Mrp/NBP35 family ATP-binding protein [Terribacillus saccharophilus]MEC0292181.1 Mrp/NBP35 family ATP-binding protein [Terribacillus saccharophilus]MEC0303481.1 Mrp/NBP35 family ATP-binding protein [Terribacillus saccharophilus]SEO17614.1 ATP-binding protein involved in chromosome partitioning [Terribacillus saccharophilus]
MVTEEKVRELLNEIEDPFLHTTLGETGAIADIRIKEEKRHVSVKILVGKTNTAEQMQLQQEIVNVLKSAGAATVGLRFDQLPQEIVDRYSQTQSSGKQQKSLLDKDTKTKFINIASGKGGVGKSTVTVNLAVALARIGFKVGIIDADIYGFSVPEMMGIEKRPEVVDDKITPVERFGVKIISMGFFVEDNGPVIWRGPMLGKMLTSFFKEVQWGDDLDYLLVDLPPGTGDVALDIHTMLPSSKEIIVTTPHPNAAFVAARAGQMALRTEHEILGVVENMAYYEVQATGEKEYVFGQGGGDKLADALETEVIGRLPLAQPYKEEGVFAPAVYQENHPLGDAYDDLARAILEKYMQ